MKWRSDPPIVVIGAVGMALVFLFVRIFWRATRSGKALATAAENGV